MKSDELPKEVIEYIQSRIPYLPEGCGNITIKVTRSGYIDVEISESKRFPIKKSGLAGQIVGGKQIIVRKKSGTG
jgi:hypothetical protein